jgi:hypothetical protein
LDYQVILKLKFIYCIDTFRRLELGYGMKEILWNIAWDKRVAPLSQAGDF